MQDVLINRIAPLCPRVALLLRGVCARFRRDIPFPERYLVLRKLYLDINRWREVVDDEQMRNPIRSPNAPWHHMIHGEAYPNREEDPIGNAETMRRAEWIFHFLPDVIQKTWSVIKMDPGKYVEFDFLKLRVRLPTRIDPPASACRLGCTDDSVCHIDHYWALAPDLVRASYVIKRVSAK